MNLLIVDDERQIRDAMSGFIRKFFSEIDSIRTAANGREALRDILPSFAPDILISDVVMPQMNGLELLSELKTKWPHCRVIMISAYDEVPYLRQSIKMHVENYILKPIDLVELRDTVTECIKQLRHSAYTEQRGFGTNLAVSEPSSINSERQLIGRIKEYVNNNYHRDIGVAPIAFHFNLSPNYCGALFKKKAGKGLAKYIIETRLHKAQELLINSNLKIREVSSMCGFQSHNYFSKLFKQNFGVSPQEFSTRRCGAVGDTNR